MGLQIKCWVNCGILYLISAGILKLYVGFQKIGKKMAAGICKIYPAWMNLYKNLTFCVFLQKKEDDVVSGFWLLHFSIFCRCILVVFHRNFTKNLTFWCFLSKSCGLFPPVRKNVTHQIFKFTFSVQVVWMFSMKPWLYHFDKIGAFWSPFNSRRRRKTMETVEIFRETTFGSNNSHENIWNYYWLHHKNWVLLTK